MQSQVVQLDRGEREKLERLIIDMRERVESDVKYQIEEVYKLKEKKEEEINNLEDKEIKKRKKLKKAIKREEVANYSWDKAIKQYIKNAGYTIVNRLTALRCMEVRDFMKRSVTKFREDDLTPAAAVLVEEDFLTHEEAIFKAYSKQCKKLESEIEILFNLDSPYSIIKPRLSTYKELCRMMDDVKEGIWLADDVLGWIYEYYNANDLDEVRRKAREEGLDPEDTTIANQFYTPHWVVRMLTDNSLGKLYLEKNNTLQQTIEEQKKFTIGERKNRSKAAEDATNIAELCTYLMPSEETGGKTTEFDKPEDISVIDPACGSGHFLLYAFDILERIWWKERPELDRSEIPGLILKHNLYGVDLDLRACQLAAFNLYLKARGRAEEEGSEDFCLPALNIVCSDAKIVDLERAREFIRDNIEQGTEDYLEPAFEEILKDFKEIQGLGSLLNVKGTIGEKFEESKGNLFTQYGSLEERLEALREDLETRNGEEGFFARDLRDFLKLLEVLLNDYDVALMNPPYGSHYGGSGRMPEGIKNYIKKHYKYSPEYYINFFEICERLLLENGRVGMLIPRSFMFKETFTDFRKDFIGEKGVFDFLAEYGMGILDNATVNTVGTVVRTGVKSKEDRKAEFIRLHDADTYEMENVFLNATYKASLNNKLKRRYTLEISKLSEIPGSPISYWVPDNLRSLYESNSVLDAENAKVDRDSLGKVKAGLQTGNNNRFVRYFWETVKADWFPFAKGGEDSWVLPKVMKVVKWRDTGKELKRFEGSVTRNEKYYFKEAITFNLIKTKDGRRFGLLNKDSIFDVAGSVFIPSSSDRMWEYISYLNSYLGNYLVLCQTPERQWNVGNISCLPWECLSTSCEVGSFSKEIAGFLLSLRAFEFTSPYYFEPLLLKSFDYNSELNLYKSHSYRNLLKEIEIVNLNKNNSKNRSLFQDDYKEIVNYWNKIKSKIHEKSEKINEIIFKHFGIDNEQQKEIITELDLRMGEDPRKAELIPEVPSLELLVKRLILHFVLKIVMEESEGIVPLARESGEEEKDILARVKEKFEDVFADYAEERLAEVDEILGDRISSEEMYPNLRHWLKKDLFKFHVNEFENTPIIWKLTSENLVSKAKDTGFSCLIDYHSLGKDTFDRLQVKYLEPRKAALRERRRAANQRRNDTSLSATERQAAEDEYERCENNLRQVEVFESKIQDLMRDNEREWSEKNQKSAAEIAEQAENFKNVIERKLEKLDRLHESASERWFKDQFSPKFYENIEKNREEWFDGLKDLSKAGKEYSKSGDKPIKAHLYDLFVYADKLLGSTHYSSNGALFVYYYYKKGEKNLNDIGELKEGLRDREKLMGELAQGVEREIDLGEELKEKCKELSKEISSRWEERAYEEITVAGYQPNKKHGVRINIKPLAEAEIVPFLVNDKVL